MNRPLAWILLALVLLLAGYLRSHRLGRWGFWMDECYSAEISAGRGYSHFDLPTNQVIGRPPDLQAISKNDPWWHVLTEQGRDVHPPLYFLVLRWWPICRAESPGCGQRC